MKKLTIILAAVLCLSMTFSAVAFAEEAAVEETAVEETVAAEAPALPVIGDEKADAIAIEVTNSTGKDIVYFAVVKNDAAFADREKNANIAIQEALIEKGLLEGDADGIFGPLTTAAVEKFRTENGLAAEGGADLEMLSLLIKDYTDGNMLNEEAFKSAEKSMLFVEKAEADADFLGSDAVAALLKDTFSMVPEYVAVIKLADEDEELVLHFVPVDAASLEICVEDGIAYVKYTDANGTAVTTLDAEKAVDELLHPVAAVNTYDDGFDDGGYAEPAPDYGYEDNGGGAQGADGCIEDGLFYDEPQGADGCIEDGLFN